MEITWNFGVLKHPRLNYIYSNSIKLIALNTSVNGIGSKNIFARTYIQFPNKPAITTGTKRLPTIVFFGTDGTSSTFQLS
jgi:hypothetical protein